MADQRSDSGAVDEAAAADEQAVEQQAGRDGGPQDEEAMAAADGLTASERTSRTYGDMLERGAHQQGEGRTP